MDQVQFGPYRLLDLLGRGGMGEVYRAHDTSTDRIVAIKLLPRGLAEDQRFQQRFLREARAAASLNEPHVVPIHRYGEIDGRLYVDMRHIEGRDLEAVLADGPISPERAVTVVEQIAAALSAAHDIGLVHRDIKPSNILLAGRDFAYLIDFGIARGANDTSLTNTGLAIGTLAYMAPERFNTGRTDKRADIYALTCVLWECLTGRPPFKGNSLEQLLAGHLMTEPPMPSAHGLPPAFDSVIATGMAKDPNHRYQSADDFAQAARHALTAPAPSIADAPTAVRQTIPVDPPTQRAVPPTPPPTQPATYQPPPARLYGVQAGPPSSGPVPIPVISAGTEPWWKRQLVTLVAVAATIITAVSMIALIKSGDKAEAVQPAPGSASQRNIDGLLLSPKEIGELMGLKEVVTALRNDRVVSNSTVTPTECREVSLGNTLTGDPANYAALRVLAVVAPGEDHGIPQSDQNIYQYASADVAKSVVSQTKTAWSACIDKDYVRTPKFGEPNTRRATNLVDSGNTISVEIRDKADLPDFSCQQVTTAVSNYVVRVGACNFKVGNQAKAIVDRIGQRIG